MKPTFDVFTIVIALSIPSVTLCSAVPAPLPIPLEIPSLVNTDKIASLSPRDNEEAPPSTVGGIPPPVSDCTVWTGEERLDTFREEMLKGWRYSFKKGPKEDTPRWDELMRIWEKLRHSPDDRYEVIPTKSCRVIFCNGELAVGIAVCNGKDDVPGGPGLSIDGGYISYALSYWLYGVGTWCHNISPATDVNGFWQYSFGISWQRDFPGVGLNIEWCSQEQDLREPKPPGGGAVHRLGYF
ncbi:hypothetical protein Dda_1570 [Drechslerella dactyloides]|uniref:Uncharacterized protein n=1 Tax=Drechslerella dactyloides TaxID=74499 RepID=A0AAD6J3B1_DREDA|nr:hypothetical protein Dda_1570 [Drechslerella dactyloides]